MRFLLFLFLSSLLVSAGISQNKYAGEFLSLGAGARASAMGGSSVATTSDVTAGYDNPAGLMRIQGAQVAYNHTKLFIRDLNYDYGAVALPWGQKRTIGFSILRLAVDNIPHTQAYRILPNGDIEIVSPDQYDPSQDRTRIKNYFNYASYAMIFSYAQHYKENILIGANVKLIHNGSRYASANGIGFDIGTQISVSPHLILGAVLQDATGTLVAWNTGKREWVSPGLKTGAAYRLNLGNDHALLPTADIVHRFENRKIASHWHWGRWSVDVQSGFEYQYKNMIFLRFGYNELNTWTTGAGIQTGILHFDYTFTYYQGHQALNHIHRIFIRFDLQTPRFLRSDS